MEYKVEDVSPVKKKISVSVGSDEVGAAIAGSVALLKNSVQMDGFRKGKVPSSVVEHRFHDRVYNEARENLISVHINNILQEKDLKPISGIQITGNEKPLVKGEDYSYVMEFEVLPDFSLPNYEGLHVEEEKSVINEDRLNALYEKILEDNAKLVPVDGTAPAQDGQIAVIDFEAFEDGKPIKDLKASNFNLELGKGEALPDFESLVKGTPVGHTAEKEIHFPDDFLAPALAGKNVTMKITVHAVKEKKIPKMDDEFAKGMGYENAEQLKEVFAKSFLESMRELNKSASQKRLLDQLLDQSNFPLPESMVELETRMLLTDLAARLEMQGQSLKSTGKSLPELINDAKPQAEEMTRGLVMLMSIAKKENLEVTDEEVATDIYKNCMRKGDDFKSTFENMRNSGMIYHLRDRLLADKAMDLVYSRANVDLVEPGSIMVEEVVKDSPDNPGNDNTANDAECKPASPPEKDPSPQEKPAGEGDSGVGGSAPEKE